MATSIVSLSARIFATPVCLTLALSTGGCDHAGSMWNHGGISSHSKNVTFTDFDAAASGLPSHTLSRTLPTPTNGPIRLMNVAGNIQLAPGEGTSVRVEATVYADETVGESWTMINAGSGKSWHCVSFPKAHIHYPAMSAGTIKLDIKGKKFQLTADTSDRIFFADLVVYVPPTVDVEVWNLVGDIEGSSLRGEVTAKTLIGSINITSFEGQLVTDTGSGNITLGDVNGDIDADTGSGDIVIATLTGKGNLDTGSGNIVVNGLDASALTTDTGSGDIELRDGTATSINADTGSGNITMVSVKCDSFDGDTGSGDISITCPLSGGRYTADTGSGNVTINGGPDAAFDLSTNTGNGKVTVAYADAALRWDKKELVGATRGDNQADIDIDTGSGNVAIAP